MAKSKNITIRLREDEYELFNRTAESKGMNRTDMIRKAVKEFASSSSAEAPKPVMQQAKEVATAAVTKGVMIKDFKHPFLSKVQSEGIEVHDRKGNLITVLHDLHGVMEFLQNKVFIKR